MSIYYYYYYYYYYYHYYYYYYYYHYLDRNSAVDRELVSCLQKVKSTNLPNMMQNESTIIVIKAFT